MQFPKERVSIESPASKYWRWWAKSKTNCQEPPHWSWDADEDQYVSLTLKSGDSIIIPIEFDRTVILGVDVFQIWLQNLQSISTLPGNGALQVRVNNEWRRLQLLRAPGSGYAYGTSLILNFDDPLDIRGAGLATFKLDYSGDPILVKSLELYAVVMPR